MEFIGKIIAILEPKSGISKAGNEWKAQEYVIEEINGQYPKRMCFEVFGDKIGQFNIQMGEILTVSFDIDARQWQERWFNSIRAWKVDRMPSANTSNSNAPVSSEVIPPFPTEEVTNFKQNDDTDELPF